MTARVALPHKTENQTTATMEKTNLNPLFIDQIQNFAHLISTKKQTKKEFINNVKNVYCTSNQKTALFCESIERSIFETIRLDEGKRAILFNQ